MKPFFIFLLLVPVSLTLPDLVAVQNDNARKKIDLRMTLKFIESCSIGENFSKSPSFAYYNIYSMKTLKGDIPAGLRNKVIDYLKGCQMKDGGFASDPEHDKTSSTVFTYYALKTLDLLDALDSVNRKKIIEFILSLTQSDGSIRAKFNDLTASLPTTYYGIASLAMMNAVNRIDVANAVIYINSYRQPRKGYCMIRHHPSMPASTCMAVKSLMLAGALTDDIKRDVVAYLRASLNSYRLQGKKYSLPAIQDLAYVLEALADLSSIDEVNKQKVLLFVESLYRPENGGFGLESGMDASLPGTYYALFCLDKLGQLRRKVNYNDERIMKRSDSSRRRASLLLAELTPEAGACKSQDS